ncbi:uncharacterized protein SAPINGB_P000979 [Magnusiomyces paraingens]|uniref:Uncharacterized protein n=1 Tax=Magnusiomyces paraingens TaxID=2606893 RepID=A0A5E8B3D3_9ASCO|nr:uncharacterized protein SAPINGB_P000979 [Saprochaete ingens]VVT45965.1 unnamed protein product [Saprochaete ingens]
MDPHGYVEKSSRRWSGNHKLASKNIPDRPSSTAPTYMPLTDPSNGSEPKRQIQNYHHHRRSAKSTEYSFPPYSPGRTVSAPQIPQHKRSSSLGTIPLKNTKNFYSYPSLNTAFESPSTANSSISSSLSTTSSRRPSKTVHFESTSADKARAKRNRHSIAVSPSEIKSSLRQSSTLFPSKEFSEDTLEKKIHLPESISPTFSLPASSSHQNTYLQTISPHNMVPLLPYSQDNRQQYSYYPTQQQPLQQQPQQPQHLFPPPQQQQVYLHPIQTNHVNANYVYGSHTSYYPPQPMHQNPTFYKPYSAPTVYGTPPAATPQSPILPMYGNTWPGYPQPPIPSRVSSSTASNQEMSNLYSTYPKRRVSNAGSISAGSSHSSCSSSESSSSGSSSNGGGSSSSSSNSSGTSIALEQPKIPLRMRASRVKAQQQQLQQQHIQSDLSILQQNTDDHSEPGVIRIPSPGQIFNSSMELTLSISRKKNIFGERQIFTDDKEPEEETIRTELWQHQQHQQHQQQQQQQQQSLMSQSQLQCYQRAGSPLLLPQRIFEPHFPSSNPTATTLTTAIIISSLLAKVKNIAMRVASKYAKLNNAPPLLQVTAQFMIFFISLDFLVNLFAKFGLLKSMDMFLINVVIASTVWAFFMRNWQLRYQRESAKQY